MYIEQIFFIAAIICAVIAALLALYLFKLKNKNKMYLKIINESTETFDAFTKTLNIMTNANNSAIGTETVEIGTITEEEAEQINNWKQEKQKIENQKLGQIDLNILQGKYEIIEEIHGGAMSRIFKARNIKLGNEWIIKFINNKNAELANEEDILKKLNHINLPQIIDIFKNEDGIFIVERFVEGFSLDKVLDVSRGKIGQNLSLDWAEQLCQVLVYLHNLKTPIVHSDLKPSNIMVTHDNKLVLIDFGISKQGTDSEVASGVTYTYAAPEQMKCKIPEKVKDLVKLRFGALPADIRSWKIDYRTDIYSLGVIIFEMLTGQIPTTSNFNILNEVATPEFAEIISKCLKINPKDRYSNAKELLAHIQNVKNSKGKMTRALLMGRVAAAVAVIFILSSISAFAASAYITDRERKSMLGIDPADVVLSEQQTAALAIEKILPDGKITELPANEIKWTYEESNIVKIEGEEIVGLNSGNTVVYGEYKNKIIELLVKVIEPMDGNVQISQIYKNNNIIENFAGNGEREFRNKDKMNSSFVSPESIDLMDDGTVVVADSGKIRLIENENVFTIDFEPSYITADLIKSSNDTMYILSDAWEEDEENIYAFLSSNDDGAGAIALYDAIQTKIFDFCVYNDKTLFFIQDNIPLGARYLCKLDLKTYEQEIISEVPNGVISLDYDDKNNIIYLGNSENGLITKYDLNNGETTNFAGVENELHFVDGEIPRFFRPQKLKVADDYLYVLDYNTVRRIKIENNTAVFAETVAGEVTTDNNPETILGSANDVVLAPSGQMDFAVKDGEILIADPKKSVIYKVLESK